MPIPVMPFQEWMLKRRLLGEDEKLERSQNIEAARAHIQVAVTERAIRELYARVEALEGRAKK